MTRLYRITALRHEDEGVATAIKCDPVLWGGPLCAVCGRTTMQVANQWTVTVAPAHVGAWPDILGTIEIPLILSQRVLEAWQECGCPTLPGTPVHIGESRGPACRSAPPPKYISLSSWQMPRVRIDFEASGFADVRFCRLCRIQRHNISKTHERQREWAKRLVLAPGQEVESPLIATDISARALLCTEDFVRMAAKYRLTNFRFVPIEFANDPFHPPEDYLNPHWKPR